MYLVAALIGLVGGARLFSENSRELAGAVFGAILGGVWLRQQRLQNRLEQLEQQQAERQAKAPQAAPAASQPQRRWLKVKTLPVAGQPLAYLADLEVFLPVDRIQIHLAENNSMAAARLSSKDSATAPKREHWRGLIYNLLVDGQSVTTPTITFGPTTSRYWRLTIDNSESALRSAPQIEFDWQPARLVFLAQGNGPFLLAYDSSEIEPARFPLEKLLQKTAAAGTDPEVTSVEPGPQFLLGGKNKLLSTPPPFPWKTWLLRMVLVTGVLLIGWMSLRLYQQLRDQENPHQD